MTGSHRKQPQADLFRRRNLTNTNRSTTLTGRRLHTTIYQARVAGARKFAAATGPAGHNDQRLPTRRLELLSEESTRLLQQGICASAPARLFLVAPQLGENAVIFEGRGVAGCLAALGNVAEQAAHDFSAAGLG
jgi:hypothetical protein